MVHVGEIVRHYVIGQILVLVLHFRSGCFFQMLSRGGVFVINSGGTINLDCEFYMKEFNLFDNPVLWRKTQHQEETQVNILGNILEPFESTHRFKVTFLSEQYRYVLGLHITSAEIEDSGNYTCQVNGPQNVLVGEITSYIFVRAPVDNVVITRERNTTSSSLSSSDSLLLTENQSNLLRCVAFGGYPPPQLSLTLDSDDVTNDFGLTYTSVTNGPRGLRVMQYTTDRWSNDFRVRATDDGKRIVCTAAISGVMPTSVSARITVHYAPIITCATTYALPGDRIVSVRCRVKARPEVTSLFWLIDVNGTMLAEGKILNEYWTMNMIQDDGTIETQLYLRQVKEENFREYRLVAENSLATRLKGAFLLKKKKVPTATLR